MSDDLTQTAFRIADEASESMVKCNALRIAACTYALTGELMGTQVMSEPIEKPGQ